eukprot:8416216-Pyramimonas_sp.AAC.1
MSADPPRSIDTPVDPTTGSATRYQCQPVLRRSLLQPMMEITALSTARRDVANLPESTIDGRFAALPARHPVAGGCA